MNGDRERVFRVTYRLYIGCNGLPFRCTKDFTDVYDFADWIKQRELNQIPTTVYGWSYGDK